MNDIFSGLATVINGENIKSKTIGNAPIKDGAVIERTVGSGAVTENKIGSLAVTNGKIGGGAVSYGKTSFTGTLDQVGVNKSDIASINQMFAGVLTVNSLTVNHAMQIGVLHFGYDTITDGSGNNVNVWTWY